MSNTINKITTKQELSERLGISNRTRAKYMNKLLYVELLKIGYNKNSNILTAAVVQFMIKEFTIIEN